MKIFYTILLFFISFLSAIPGLAATLTIPEGTKSISAAKYRFNESIDTVIIPASVTSIGMRAFADCPNLKCVIFSPKSILRTIPERCFEECRDLESIVLPAGLFKIDRHAFTNCRSLRAIDLPKGIKTIGMNAFAFCEALEGIEIPSSVTNLDSYAFASCSALEYASLPSNSAQLGELIFASCCNLKEIHACSKIPPKFECGSYLIEPQLQEYYKDIILIVPQESKLRYKNASGWKIFHNIQSDS